MIALVITFCSLTLVGFFFQPTCVKGSVSGALAFTVKLLKVFFGWRAKDFKTQNMYRNKNIEKLENEIWVDVIYFDGSYSVSNLGRVKSERRLVNNGKGGRLVKERILAQWLAPDGRLSVHFSIQNVRSSHAVSVLVWESFNEERPEGKVIMHKNKNQSDNRLCNLELTTISNSHSVNFRLGLLPHLEEQHALMVGSKWNKEHGIYVNGELTEILCNKCFVHKPISDFEHTRNCCKQCRSASFGIKEFGKLEYLKSLKDAGLKRCYKCTEVKSVNDFHKGANKCKQCKTSYNFEKIKESAGKKLLII